MIRLALAVALLVVTLSSSPADAHGTQTQISVETLRQIQIFIRDERANRKAFGR